MNKKDNWFIVEEGEISHYLFVASPLKEMTCYMEDFGFFSLDYSGVEFFGEKANYIFVEREWHEAAKKYLELIKKDFSLLDNVNNEATKSADGMFDFGRKLLATDCQNLSNQELGELYNKFEYIREYAHVRRVVMWIMETGGEVFSKYMIDYLNKEIKKQGLDFNASTIFSILSTPLVKNNAATEKESFLNLALTLKRTANLTDNFIKEKLAMHVEKYKWLPYGVSGPAWGEKYFFDTMKELLKKEDLEIEKDLQEAIGSLIKIEKQQKEILDKLQIDDLHLQLLRGARESIQMKSYTKEAMFFAFFAAENLFREISKRLKIGLPLFYRMLPWEISPALNIGEVDKQELQNRYDYSLFYAYKGKVEIFTGEKAVSRLKELNLIRSQKEDIEDIQDIKGNCARQGKATGVVKIIISPKDIFKMKSGDILVSKMTDPQIVSAMKIAGAIVTDMGGITCHAAIVARELGIPCIIGTKIATQVLKDGDLVEVDAEKGIIKILK